MKPRVGIYPGTFDPIHPGHIAFAREAVQACGLAEVVFLPERRPRDKQNVTDISHRTALIELATKPFAALSVLHASAEQFSVAETMPELRSTFDGKRLTFLIGSDVVRTFPYRWEGLDVLFREVAFAIGMRSSDDPHEIEAILTDMKHTYKTDIDYTYVFTPAASFTSSQIRNDASDMSQLDPTVAAYIRRHGLYS